MLKPACDTFIVDVSSLVNDDEGRVLLAESRFWKAGRQWGYWVHRAHRHDQDQRHRSPPQLKNLNELTSGSTIRCITSWSTALEITPLTLNSRVHGPEMD